MVDSRLAFDIMARDDGATAVLDKVARSADKTGNALKKNSKISEEAAKASEKLTKAHDNESTALERVHLAEEKLSEVRNNSKAKTSQVVAAENALSKARRDAAAAGNVAQKAAKDLEKVLDNEGKKAGKSLGSSLKNWFTGGGKNVFKQVGEDGGTVFGSGLLGALKTPVIGPAIIATLGGAVAVAAPAVGSILASGIVAGFGAGIAGLGLVFAAKSEVVKRTWSSTLADMGARMRILSKPFESTLITMSQVANRTFMSFAPILGEAFKRMAPVLTSFGDQLGRGLERLKPAILPLTDAFNAVIKSLGPATQQAIGKVSDGLVRLADSVKKNPDGLADLVDGMGRLTQNALNLVTALNNANGALERFTGGTSAVDLALGGGNSKLGQFIGLLKNTIDPLSGVKNLVDQVAGSSDKATTTVADLGKAATLTGGAAGDMGAKVAAFNATASKTAPTIASVSDATATANRNARALAAQFDRQAAATQRSNDALTRQANLLLSLSGSQIAYQQAVDDATAAVKANGKTLDLNTQKGRDNRTALNNVAQAAIAQVTAMRSAGDGNVRAAKFAEQARVSFVKQATQMGMSKSAAQALAVSLIKIPNVTRTAKLQANKADLDAKLAKAKAQLADKDLTKERRAKLTAEIAALQAAVARAKAAIAGVQGKTVYINAIVRQRGQIKAADPRLGVPGRASGGPITTGMPYMVGEHGPELVVPRQSATVIPNGRSAGMLGGTTNNFYVTVTGALDSRDAADKIVEQLRKFVRGSAGGNVQAALGR